jgi:hypothetical protein
MSGAGVCLLTAPAGGGGLGPLWVQMRQAVGFRTDCRSDHRGVPSFGTTSIFAMRGSRAPSLTPWIDHVCTQCSYIVYVLSTGVGWCITTMGIG